MSQTQIAITTDEAYVLRAALQVLNKKLQEEGGAVSTAAPARKGKASPNQAAIDKAVIRRQQRIANK